MFRLSILTRQDHNYSTCWTDRQTLKQTDRQAYTIQQIGAQGTQALICHKSAQRAPNCKHLITYSASGLILHYFNPNTVMQSRHSPVNNNNNGNNNSKYRKKKNYQTHTWQMYSNHKVLSHKMHTTNTNLHHNCITMWHFIIIIIIIAMINLVNIHGKIADIRRRVGLFIFKYDELADAELFFCSLWSGKLFFETQCITQSKTVIC